ncbi:unnamed protein product [marine sediment metagenome]|uniref:Uncharacterized protein n=1 Tax=marine sediment metagenome TaxID=412755 RepID=X0U0U2_9ZZZZ
MEKIIMTTKINCPEHGAMLCYGQHGDIRIYRCELVNGTHREIWVHKIEVKPHLYLKSKEGKSIKTKLV